MIDWIVAIIFVGGSIVVAYCAMEASEAGK